MCGRMQVRCFSRLLLLMLMLMLALVGLNPPSVYACPCRLQVQLIWPARPAFVDLDRPRPAIGARPPTSTLSASAAGPAQPRVVDVGGLGMPMYVRRPGLVLRGDTQSLEYQLSLARPTSVVVSQLGFGGPTRVDVARQPSLAPPAFVDVASGLGKTQPGLGPPAFVDVESRQGLGTPMPVDVSCQPGLAPPVVGNVRRPGPQSVNVVGVARPTLVGDVQQLGPQPAYVVDVAVQARPMPAAVAADVAPRQLPTVGVDAAAYQPPTSVAAASQYAAMQAKVAVRTTARTLTAQSLQLLDRHSPQTSSDASVHQWLQSCETCEPRDPPPCQVESSLSSIPSEVQQALPLGADAAMLAPRTSRMSRTASHWTRRTRHSATSSLAVQIFGFSRKMTTHMTNMVTQIQAQAQVQYEHCLLYTSPSPRD